MRSGNLHRESGDLRGDLGQFRDGDLVRIAEHDGAKHRVLELADIARPIEARDQRHRLGGEAANALFLARGKMGEEGAREIGHVLAPPPQRRNADREHVQPIEQILAEAALAHQLDEVAVGGGNDAHVNLDGLASADRIDLAMLDGAQELRLGRVRQFADFVEKEGAAIRFDEFPCMFSVAPVKAPFSCPKSRDSTRFSGMAPQLTVTKVLPRRSLAPWIARATSSLPTPDSPSISTGMVDFAVRSPRRMTRPSPDSW